MTRYGFIGTGSMGSMLIRNFIRTGVVAPQEITACSRTGISAHALSAETGIVAGESNRDVAQGADVLFICVRPLDVHQVLGEIRDVLQKETLLISIAGCVTLTDIAAWSGPGDSVCEDHSQRDSRRTFRDLPRCMEQLDHTCRQGACLYPVLCDRDARRDRRKAHRGVLRPDQLCTRPVRRDDAGVCCRGGAQGRRTPALAEFLVRHTLIGTAWLLTGKETGFEQIIHRVATPSGITEEGVKVLRSRLPAVYDELLVVTLAKHASIKEKIAEQNRDT